MRFMITVDAMGMPARSRDQDEKALAELNGSGELEVFVDNEIAVQNVSKMAANAGGDVASEQISREKYRWQSVWRGWQRPEKGDTEEKQKKNRQRRLPEKREETYDRRCVFRPDGKRK